MEKGSLEQRFIDALSKIKEKARKFPGGWVPLTAGQLAAAGRFGIRRALKSTARATEEASLPVPQRSSIYWGDSRQDDAHAGNPARRAGGDRRPAGERNTEHTVLKYSMYLLCGAGSEFHGTEDYAAEILRLFWQ